jgi:hypothetical protein
MAVGLLAAVTLQAASVLTSARQAAGVLLYVPQALLGSVMYLKYRLYVRIPMEELRHW